MGTYYSIEGEEQTSLYSWAFKLSIRLFPYDKEWCNHDFPVNNNVLSQYFLLKKRND